MVGKHGITGWRLRLIVALAAATGLVAGLSPSLAAPPSANASDITTDPNATFSSLTAPFTQELWAVSETYPVGVAFAANGDVLTCYGGGHRFAVSSVSNVHGSMIHAQTIFASGCNGLGLTNHPDGYIYNNTASGVTRLDPNNNLALVTGPFGAPGNNYGIATDPQTGNLVYMGGDSTVQWANSSFTSSGTFSANSTGHGLIDQIAFDPTGNFLFLAGLGDSTLVVLRRDGTVAQVVHADHTPDGVAFHGLDPHFVVTNDTDGTLNRFDFPNNDYAALPTQTVLASGAGYGDHTGVGPDGCWYVSNGSTKYADGTPAGTGLVRICPGFQPPPGVTPPVGNVRVLPPTGVPGKTFAFFYSCPTNSAPRFTIVDQSGHEVTRGMTIGLPVTNNQKDYIQTVVSRIGGTFSGVVTCGGVAAGSATFIVKVTSSHFYAALGDSYSSGEGNPPFDPDSISDGCHRSPQAWPRLVHQSNPNIKLVAHIACSGATTQAIFDKFKGELPQLIQLRLLPTQPDIVTITIGGNDVGFSDILQDCFVSNCVLDRGIANTRGLIDHLSQVLPGDYRAIQATVPRAKIVVVGYPRLFPDTQAEAVNCGWLSQAERTSLNDLSSQLNGVIAVAAAQAKVTYAPVQEALDGHELCSADSWMNPIGFTGGDNRGHPNALGQQAIEAAVLPKL